jgi:D-alanyl-D-alanine carboxypeptidase
MMTLLVVLRFMRRHKLVLKEVLIKVSAVCAHITGTSAFLRHREEVTVHDLLYGMMLPSGNDAAGVLAEGIGTYLYFEENGV